jgi:D-alanyl-D-alanine carboxypeptidase
MMLGISAMPTVADRSGTVARSDELASFLQVGNIEARNGRLATTELTAVTGAWNGTGYLLPPAADAWEEMRAAAAADGVDLQAIDTYRSYEVQEGAYQAHLRGEKAANVLPPGESEHGNGLAVDITNGHLVGVGDREYTWLRTHAAQYGWFPISNESWHWEFRGV